MRPSAGKCLFYESPGQRWVPKLVIVNYYWEIPGNHRFYIFRGGGANCVWRTLNYLEVGNSCHIHLLQGELVIKQLLIELNNLETDKNKIIFLQTFFMTHFVSNTKQLFYIFSIRPEALSILFNPFLKVFCFQIL